MTAATADRNTKQRIGGVRSYPIANAVKIYKGTLCMLDAGYAKPGATATGKICIGRAIDTYDNTSGAAGAITGEFEFGEFRWANGGAATQANVGAIAYITDDQTVDDDATGRSKAGMFTAIDTVGAWVETPGSWV